jgi:crotonobetainyl-CoA:carnitine CoA-transferase CaiB-like acyl-CoA transferase
LSQPAAPLLSGVLVVDLTDSWGELAGRNLADLGATVLKIEPPGGTGSRRKGPFDGRPGHEGESLYWAAVGRGKRSVVVDLDEPGALGELQELCRQADVVIESYAPGYLAGYGLDHASLGPANPGLIYASITPWGQDGPFAAAPATELTVEAAGGLLSLTGDGDRPNVPVGYPQSAFHAGAQAAADICIALHERMRSGLGQYLDVAAQPAMVWTLMSATGWPPNEHKNPANQCEERATPPKGLVPGVDIPRLWQCADGWVSFTITLARIGARSLQAVMRWMEREGSLSASLHGMDWTTWGADVAEGKLAPGAVQQAVDEVIAFFQAKTKLELQTFGMENEILLAAIYNSEDVVNDPHHAARNFFEMAGGRKHPGPWIRMSEAPLMSGSPAEPPGASQELLRAWRSGAAPAVSGAPRAQPFAGLKVADFAWVGVGPLISKALADHGATVVHIESSTAPDVLRLAPPFRDGVAGIDNAQFMANFNSSKIGVAANLSTEEGREVARMLVAWADVVVESYTPGTMAKWGLDYATISKDRPDLVMLSTCLRGQTGPERSYTGFGGQGAAMAGIHHLTAWPGRAPTGPWGAYTDFINPRFGVAALSATLIRRARTGRGQYLDLSQVEAGAHFVEPVLLDYSVNGNVWPAMGHDSIDECPHGVFATEGEERYIAISTATEEQWQALCTVAPVAEFAGLRSYGKRQAKKQAIEDALRAWCLPQEGFALAERLRAAGVPASMVLRPSDLYEDAQLAHRGFFVTLDHSNMGPTPYDGPVTIFSETPAILRKAAPCLGEDTHYVLAEILGYDETRIAELAEAGALT